MTAYLAACAAFDPTGRYRYALERKWADGPTLAFVMLNPSTADAAADDPTIRRCVSFARRDGFAAIEVVNLYAYRATCPDALWSAFARDVDIVGPDNDAHVRRAATHASRVVVAWGAKIREPTQAARVLRMLRQRDVDVRCLGNTKAGHPRHPLYLRGDTPLVSLAGGTP